MIKLEVLFEHKLRFFTLRDISMSKIPPYASSIYSIITFRIIKRPFQEGDLSKPQKDRYHGAYLRVCKIEVCVYKKTELRKVILAPFLLLPISLKRLPQSQELLDGPYLVGRADKFPL